MSKVSTAARPDSYTRPSQASEKRRARHFALANSPWPWLTPLALVLLFVFLYPVIDIIRLSFTDATIGESDVNYTTQSFAQLLRSPDFVPMLRITLLFVLGSVVFQMLLGFIIAEVVNVGQQRRLRGTVITRTAVLTAWAIPGAVIGIIWGLLYQESDAGILNYILHPLAGHAVPFLSQPQVALISVTIANVWRGTAFSMILIYAGLQTLPIDVTEAAKVDGANAWQRLFRITIPQLAPVLLLNLLLILIDTFNTFDMVLALTGGGPGRSTEVIALSVYEQIFENLNLGVGAATAVLLLLINLIMTVVYIRFVELGRRAT
jgi:multiple sugar transport system permease protein